MGGSVGGGSVGGATRVGAGVSTAACAAGANSAACCGSVSFRIVGPLPPSGAAVSSLSFRLFGPVAAVCASDDASVPDQYASDSEESGAPNLSESVARPLLMTIRGWAHFPTTLCLAFSTAVLTVC